MALVKVDHVLKLMRKEECPYWRLTDNQGSNRNVIDENDNEENIESAIESLEEALSQVDDNVICVMISDKSKKNKAKGGRGFKQYEFKINLGRKETGGLSATGNNGMLGMLLAQMEKTNQLQVQFMELQKERQFDELKQEMKKLKEGDKIDKYMPYLNKMFGVESPVGIAEVGTEDATVNQTIVDNQKKVREALKRLAKVDKQLPDTLTKLATFAENNSAAYFQYMKML